MVVQVLEKLHGGHPISATTLTIIEKGMLSVFQHLQRMQKAHMNEDVVCEGGASIAHY